MSLEYVTLVLDAYDAQGNIVTKGSASFVPSVQLTDPGVEWIPPAPIPAVFRAGSVPSVKLLSTDSTDALPNGWTWSVTFSAVPGDPDGFSFYLAHSDGATQYLSSLAEVPAVTPTAQYQPLPSGTAEAGQVPVATGSGSGSAWTTLTAADVDADAAGTSATETIRAEAAEALLVPLNGGQAIGTQGYDERYAPVFTRFSGNPVLTVANQNPSGGSSQFEGQTPPVSAFAPSVVNMQAIPGVSPIDNWYMYYSTNHDDAKGGIYLVTAPAPTGPWTFQGLAYQDQTNSTVQTENPAVIFNDDTGVFHLYYKALGVGVGAMATKLVTSATGLFSLDSSATAVGIVLDAPAAGLFPGDASFAYFKPFRIGREWIAYHLVGGGSPPTYGISRSPDGLTWQTDGNPLLYGCDQIVDSALPPSPLAANAIQIAWNWGHVIRWRGEPWWFGLLSDFSSGLTAKNARLACAPLTRDFRHLRGRPQIFGLPTVGSNESVDYQAVHFHAYLGKVYCTYVCSNTLGYFNVTVSQ